MWQFLFWLSAVVIAYTYIGYPLILFALSRFKRHGHNGADRTELPSVCLVISAFNEERVIREKLENSLSLDYPRDRYTIVVASDGSNDRTVPIARQYEDAGVRVLHYPVRSGKSAVLNRVSSVIDEDIVVYTDANSLFSKDALKNLVRPFGDASIGCVVGKLRYVDERTSSVGKSEGAYWKYEGILSVLESAIGSVLVANGSIFGVRRDLLVELYPEVANDFQIPTEVTSRGYRVVYEPSAVALEPCAYYWHEEFQRKIRIILRGLTGLKTMSGKFRGLRLWQFFSHKLLRWSIAPFLFLLMLASASLANQSAFYGTVFALQIVFYLAAINGWRIRKRKSHPLFHLPFYFTMVNLAAIVAVSRFASGERQAVWDKAESARVPSARVIDEVPAPLSFRPVTIPADSELESARGAERVAKP